MICEICPHRCDLRDSEVGRCLVRSNQNGRIVANSQVSAIAVEPIEKRPFFHYMPGSKWLSVGFFGCSMSCSFCLPGDTLIRTPEGLKRMDQIQDGDEIIVADYSSSYQQLVLAHVGHVSHREAEELIELQVDGQTIQLTPEHPVYTRRGWVEAVNLTADDEVLCDKTYLESLRSGLESGDLGIQRTGQYGEIEAHPSFQKVRTYHPEQ